MAEAVEEQLLALDFLFSAFFALFFLPVLGVDILDFERLEIPIEERLPFFDFILLFDSDLVCGVALNFLTDFSFGVFATFFCNKFFYGITTSIIFH